MTIEKTQFANVGTDSMPNTSPHHQGAFTQHTNFLPHTTADREAMLATMGRTHTDELFADIPSQLQDIPAPKNLPITGLDEWALHQAMTEQAANNTAAGMTCFLGGGAYARFIPQAVNTIASRGEFYTAYTPYQPEMSQGTLQVGFEFQSMIAELTGMDAANASVYDGGTAVAEAAMMAIRIKKKRPVIAMLRSVHPQYRHITKTYIDGFGGLELLELDDLTAAKNLAGRDDIAAIILQQPSYLGTLSDLNQLRQACDDCGALMIVSADPVSLGVLETPGNAGADIVVGDIQPLGNNLFYGGPYGGYMATKQAYVRQLPGRLVGKATDADGRPCYTLTMQTREQHIRREKATSNICTNQALNILKSTVYMTLVGPQGLAHVAGLSMLRARQLVDKLTVLPGITRCQLGSEKSELAFEVALQFPVPVADVLAALENANILGGIPLESDYPEFPNSLLIACTEVITKADIERYVSTVTQCLKASNHLPPGDSHSPTSSTTTSQREACHT